MWDWIGFGITLVLSLLVWKLLLNYERKNLKNYHGTILMLVLDGAVQQEKISGKTAGSILAAWDHYSDPNTKHVRCACRSVELHCDKDRELKEGIEHRAKFCDTPPV